MKKLISTALLAILMSQLIVQPVIAYDMGQVLTGAGQNQNAASGMSFRKGDATNLQSPDGQNAPASAQDMLNKGMMISDPTLVGLTYQVHVLGEVKSPGTYKITASDRLSEVLNKAGGVTDQGSQRNVEVRRKGEGSKKIDLLKFQLFGELSENPYLLDNDVVFVPLKKSTIQVVGAIKRPKEYEVKGEKTLFDAINLAGGVSVGAAKEVPIKVVRFVDNKKEVVEVAFNETDMKAFNIQNGDTIFIPHMITENNKFDYDVPKLPGDNIFYPSFEDRVFVLGGVQKPGAYTFSPYYSLPQYLSLAGGTTKLSTDKISILSPDGDVTKVSKKNKNTVVINPGDTILIKERRIPPEGWVTLVMSIASFGLSATATALLIQERM